MVETPGLHKPKETRSWIIHIPQHENPKLCESLTPLYEGRKEADTESELYEIISRQYVQKRIQVEKLNKQINKLQQEFHYANDELYNLYGMKVEAEKVMESSGVTVKKQKTKKKTKDISKNVIDLWLDGEELETISDKVNLEYKDVKSIIDNYIDGV